MSARVPGKGTARGDERAGRRVARIIAAVLLALVVLLLAVAVLRRVHGQRGSGPTVVRKAPPAPAVARAPETAGPPPAAPAAAPVRAEAGGPGPAGRGAGAPASPIIVGDGVVRIFIDGTGTVSIPLVVRERGTRLAVESAGDRRPAEVLVAAGQDGSAAVSVLSGAADIAAAGRTVRAAAGTFTTVAGGSPPAAPSPLPPPPVPAAPSDAAAIPYGSLPPRIAFSWRPRSVADGFRFVLARDPEFRRIVLDERVAGPGVTTNRLEEGTYHWRVSAVAGAVEGLPCAASRLTVVHRATPPRLQVRPAARSEGGNARVVAGTTDPGAKVFVAGAPVPVSGTGSFSGLVRVDGPVAAIVVEALDPLGNVAYHSQWQH